jgi:hypothetical protein
MIIYHGSSNIIKKPIFHGGKETNDYGFGFYCTESLELAKEWACVDNETNGYANKYEINLNNLKVLDLTSKEYSILNWISILLRYRTFDITSPIALESKEYLLKNFYIDISKFDVVIGYRADDSYFKFAKDFINNTISIQQLKKAMELGQLGKQVVLISELAHNSLKYISSEISEHNEFYTKKIARDKRAREEYLQSSNIEKDIENGIFVRDIIKGGIKNGDSSL